MIFYLQHWQPAGVDAKPESDLDGVNLLPYLKGESDRQPHEVLYWRSWGQMAVRKGDWKLVRYTAKMDDDEFPYPASRKEVTPMRLYNLKRDIGESNDLSSREPEKFTELRALWDTWNAELGPEAQWW